MDVSQSSEELTVGHRQQLTEKCDLRHSYADRREKVEAFAVPGSGRGRAPIAIRQEDDLEISAGAFGIGYNRRNHELIILVGDQENDGTRVPGLGRWPLGAQLDGLSGHVKLLPRIVSPLSDSITPRDLNSLKLTVQIVSREENGGHAETFGGEEIQIGTHECLAGEVFANSRAGL